MLIDWFTVAAQALNFLVLVWLMKRFLYKPILDAIAAREQLIASELADAAAKKAEAIKEREAFEHKNEALDRQRSDLMDKATDEVKVERKRLLDEARKAADVVASKQQRKLEGEARRLHQAIALRTQQEVFAIARRTLADLATARLEASMSDLFARRLRGLDGKPKDVVANALRTASETAIVRSAFDLDRGERESIQKALDEVASAQIEVRFETAPDVIAGIELTASGQKVAWSIDDYLATLEHAVDELADAGDARDVPGDSEPVGAVGTANSAAPAAGPDAQMQPPIHP